MILELFTKPFPTESKKQKKKRRQKKKLGKKRKRGREERTQKVKGKGAVKLSRKKILISAHAQTSKAVICLQERKLV